LFLRGEKIGGSTANCDLKKKKKQKEG